MIETKRDLIKMLMKRDHLSQHEAKYLIDYTQQLIDEAMEDGDIWIVEDILAENLGIEPDYIYTFLF